MSEAYDKQPVTKRKKRNWTLLASGVLIVALVALLMIQFNRPERSVAAYCSVYKQQKSRLSAMSKNDYPYPSGLFNVNVTDAAQIAASLGKLDRVAPMEIEPEIHSLQRLYQDIHDNASHAINDSLNGGSLDDSLKAWTQQRCGNN